MGKTNSFDASPATNVQFQTTALDSQRIGLYHEQIRAQKPTLDWHPVCTDLGGRQFMIRFSRVFVLLFVSFAAGDIAMAGVHTPFNKTDPHSVLPGAV